MSTRRITCITCGTVKELSVHKAGYVGADAVILFQRDGWLWIGHGKGKCGDCPRLNLEEK